MNKIEIVISKEELDAIFPDYIFPFQLTKAIRNISKNEGVKYIADELSSLLLKDSGLNGSTLLTSKAIKSCGVYKIRIKKDNNKGKSSGYRVVFLLVTPLGKGFVLDIYDHSEQDDLTDKQKKFCNKLVNDLDKALKDK